MKETYTQQQIENGIVEISPIEDTALVRALRAELAETLAELERERKLGDTRLSMLHESMNMVTQYQEIYQSMKQLNADLASQIRGMTRMVMTAFPLAPIEDWTLPEDLVPPFRGVNRVAGFFGPLDDDGPKESEPKLDMGGPYDV